MAAETTGNGDATADAVADTGSGIDSPADTPGGGNDGAPDSSTVVDAGPDTFTTLDRDGGLSCTNLPSISTCLCTLGGGDSIPCSPDSVINGAPNQAAVCCNTPSQCSCQAFACKSASSGYNCACGGPAVLSTMPSLTNQVASCPTPTGSQRCCLSTNTTQCYCVPFDCDPGDMRVDSCAPSTLAVCATGSVAVARCN
jgi:hypothetical protein